MMSTRIRARVSRVDSDVPIADLRRKVSRTGKVYFGRRGRFRYQETSLALPLRSDTFFCPPLVHESLE
jgi:hypothetical protein